MVPINIIVAVSDNGVIGRDGKLPWYIPTDLARFRILTNGSSIIMGRKTYQSLGRPLSNRQNIVVTSQKFEIDDCLVAPNLVSAIGMATEDQIFIIGGAEIYEEAFSRAHNLFLTKILSEVDGDTYLKGFILDEWSLYSTSEPKFENGILFQFQNYVRK
jgi:dihydrofolate reductase